jgi:hypothetical protein
MVVVGIWNSDTWTFAITQIYTEVFIGGIWIRYAP